jgi:hypothetical protein
MRSPELVLVAGLLAAAARPLRAQTDSVAARATVRGRVIDARTAFPLGSVVVILTDGRDTLARAQSDSTGAFILSDISPTAASAVAHFTRSGYRADSLTAEIATAVRTPLRVAMIPSAAGATRAIASRQAGDPGSVNAAGTAGFDARAAHHAGGVFITSADIERRSAVRTSDLFRGVSGVTVIDSGGVPIVVSSRGVQSMFTASPTVSTASPSSAGSSGGGASTGRGGSAPGSTGSTGGSVNVQRCTLRVGLDGRLMDPSFAVDEVPVTTIHGIEVYPGASTVPIEFNVPGPGTPCGVIMIWTRTGDGHHE